jgi:hypothetical protein
MASGGRQAARRRRLDTEGMIRWMFVLVALLATAVFVGPAAAQEPQEPPVTPHTLRLVERAPGAYTLIAEDVATALGPYVVRAHVFRIGTDHGVVITLAESDDDRLSLDVPLPLDGMTEDACYSVGFSVAPQDETKTELYGQGAGIDTRACVDAGVVTFPAFDGVTSPPPAPPSNVRIVRVPASEYPDAGGDTWTIEWTDNSSDEVSFDPGIILMDKPWGEGGSAIEGLELPEVQRNQTRIGSIGFFFAPDGPPEPVCGYALVLVFAIGPDSPSIWPGNTTVPACFGYGTISFPDAGAGEVRSGGDGLVETQLALVAMGAACLALAVWLRQRRRRRYGA